MTIPARPHAEAAPSLSEALVVSSNAPVLLFDGDLTVVAASASFFQTFQIDPILVPGRALEDIGDGEWNAGRLRSL